MLHPDLQKLLDYALQDGELSEKEREILHKKAIELGEDIDVLEMVIEGELQKISKNKKDEKQKRHDCPNCGNSIPSSSIKCGFCGFEVSKVQATGENYINKLNTQLEKVNEWHSEAISKDKWGLKQFQIDSSAAQQKATIISTFTMPGDKEHLLEFFHFCHGNYESNFSGRFILIGAERAVQKNINTVAKAFQGKAKTAYEKLKRFINEDEEIKSVVIQFKERYDNK